MTITRWSYGFPVDLMSDLCADHDEPNCLLCFDEHGHISCHHPDHEDFCPFEEG